MNKFLLKKSSPRDQFVTYLHSRYHHNFLLFAHGICKRFGLDISYANDLVQEFYTAALVKHLTMKKGYEKGGLAYLMGVMKNDILDLVRKQKSTKRVEEIFCLKAPKISHLKDLCFDMDAEGFKEALARILTLDNCQIMIYYIEGYSYKEIAQAIDMNENTVATRIRRAKKTIANHFGH